jgi:hypothetical protein
VAADGERIPFNDLPAPVRARFVACLNGKAEPTPLLAATNERIPSLYAILAVVPATALALMLVGGFGIQTSGVGALSSGVAVTALYGLVIALFVITGIAFARAVARQRALPWVSGRYLFPGAFIDATTSELRVVSMASFVQARELIVDRERGSIIELHFEGNVVEAVSRAAGDDPLDLGSLKGARARLERAQAKGDRSLLASLDPLADGADERADALGGYRSNKRAQRTEGPVAKAMPAWLRRPFLSGSLATIASVTLLATAVLPGLAVRHANACHETGAYRDVAVMWPYDWVQVAVGVRLASPAELIAALPAMRSPSNRAALLGLLQTLESTRDHFVPSYVTVSPDPEALAARAHGQRIGVALQHSIGLPLEALAIHYEGDAPPQQAPSTYVRILCSLKPRETVHVLNYDVEKQATSCSVELARGDVRTQLASVLIEPEQQPDLAKVVADLTPSPPAEGEQPPPAATREVVERAVQAALLDRAMARLEPAFKHELYASP